MAIQVGDGPCKR